MLLHSLYLLQLENYELVRFLRVLWRTKGLPSGPPRKKIVWTQKLAFVFALALAMQALLAAQSGIWTYVLGGTSVGVVLSVTTAFVVLSLFYPLFLVIAVLIVLPLDWLLKRRIIRAAARKIRAQRNLAVIGIAGSYGKTTTKEMIATLLGEKYQVVKTPENINTLVGVARVILKEVRNETEVLVVEMGEHYRGDIKDLCELAPPDVAVVTGITEAHIERMGSIGALTQTIFEIVCYAKPQAKIYFNADSDLVREKSGEYLAGRTAFYYSVHTASAPYRGSRGKPFPLESRDPVGIQREAGIRVANEKFFEDGSGQEFDLWEGKRHLGRFTIPFLGDYARGTFVCAVLIARAFGLSKKEITFGARKLTPVPHRLQAIQGAGDILVIDDSYNGNPEGVREAIRTLGKFKNRRKVYITPGLVEIGEKTRDVHVMIGQELARVANLVLLIRTSAAPYIAEGLMAEGFSEKNIMWFKNAPEAHAALPQILTSGDVILFQNDWSDNYS